MRNWKQKFLSAVHVVGAIREEIWGKVGWGLPLGMGMADVSVCQGKHQGCKTDLLVQQGCKFPVLGDSVFKKGGNDIRELQCFEGLN